MARFSGKIGFVRSTETDPGVFEETCTERNYRGDLITRKVRIGSGDGSNPSFSLNNELSIVADNFAKENIGYMRYAIIHGVKWMITDATLLPPRISLSIGGMYN